MPYSDPFKALAYGPVVGEYGRDQMIGAYDNPLGQYDVALSPDKLKKYPLGSFVTAHDKAGNVLGNYRVADTSYYTPGKPTSNTVEFRDQNRSGQVFLSPSSTPPPGTGPYQYQAPGAGPSQTAAAASPILQQVLDNYGIGGPTGTPSGYAPGIAQQPTPGQQFAGNMGDLISKVFSAYAGGVARRKYNPYLPG